MKILVVTAHDAVNLSIENVIREFIQRGHEVQIFAKLMEYRHIRMFEDLPILIHPISELNRNEVEKFDVAFCPMDGVNALAYYNIYVFSYNFLFVNRWTSYGGDFMFVQTENRPILQWEDCARMAVGNPKNDTKIFSEQNKRILFIDTGHFPFGMEGKKQVANTILAICRKFPDYTVTIKPRWLQREKNNIHASRVHIFDVIFKECNGKIPANLELLNEYRDMQELIDRSTTVITPGSSAYLDAVLRGKNLLILSGLSSENSYDLRIDTTWKEQYEVMEDSGCVVDYRDVLDYLPEGVKCSEEHINKVVAFRGNVSAHVVDVIEFVYKKILAFGKFPKIASYTLEKYQDEIIADATIDFHLIKQKRNKNQALTLSRRFDWTRENIDYQSWLNTLNLRYRDYPPTQTGYELLKARMKDELYNLWISNKEKLSEEDMGQSLYLQALADTGRINEILDLQQDIILCTGPYHYYLGIIFKKQNQKTLACEHFCRFLKEANARTYNRYPQEEDWGISKAYNYIFENYDEDNLPANDFASIYVFLFERRNPTIVVYKNRKRAHNLLPNVANRLVKSDSSLALKCLRLYAEQEYHYNIRELDNQVRKLRQDINDLTGSRLYRIKNEGKRVKEILIRGIRCLREHGWKYTWMRGIERIHKIIRRKGANLGILQLSLLFREKIMRGYQVYSRVIQNYESCEIILSAPGVGDNYIHGRCFKSIARNWTNSPAVHVFGVFGESGVGVAELFGIEYVEPFSQQELNVLHMLALFDVEKVCRVRIMYPFLSYIHTGILRDIVGLHGFNLLSETMTLLDVERENELCNPVFEYNSEMLLSIFREKRLRVGKTVVLSPYAKSVKPINQRFWNKLVQRLIAMDYSVCTNCVKMNEFPLNDTSTVFVPWKYSVPFIEMAGAVIGLRSGFCDVISTAKCPKITLYPQTNYAMNQICRLNNFYNMSDMYHQPNQYDICYSEDIEEKIIHQITRILESSFTREAENNII